MTISLAEAQRRTAGSSTTYELKLTFNQLVFLDQLISEAQGKSRNLGRFEDVEKLNDLKGIVHKKAQRIAEMVILGKTAKSLSGRPRKAQCEET